MHITLIFLSDSTILGVPYASCINISCNFFFTHIMYIGFGFNSGSALLLRIDEVGEVAATAATNTALSGAAGGVSALFTNLFIVERLTGEPYFSILVAMNGALSGLVAITSGCGVVEPWAAIVIGIVAGWIYIGASSLLVRLRIDDAVDAIPVHMFNGMWGVFSTGLLASPRLMEVAYNTGDYPGLFYAAGNDSSFNLLGCQVTLIVFILGWVCVTMLPFFIWLNYKGWLRADSLEELVGLDVSYHGSDFDNKYGDVNKEYVAAFKRQRGSLRANRRIGGRSSSRTFDNPETNLDAAQEDAYED